MTCDLCRHIVDREDVPHTVRTCKGCGRVMHVYEPGEHGRGIRIEKGDQFVIPAGWLRLSLNPLKSTGTFTRAGLQWFAKHIFVEDLPTKEADSANELELIEQHADRILRSSTLLKEFDIDNPDHAEKEIAIITENPDTPEWWAFWAGTFVSIVKEALTTGEVNRAIWAMACAERCRAMLIFGEHLEEVVWMGHSAKRIVDILRVWDMHKANGDEEFWQLTFNENTYVLWQVFAVPVVFIKDKAYVGGMKIDRSQAKFVDYLLSTESSREAVLIEIKTPVTRLLGSEYRSGVYAPSAELSGAVVQILGYRSELVRNLRNIIEGAEYDINTFNPKCVLLIGDASAQLSGENQRKSFELFRGGLRDVEIVTYDELFRRVKILANLFSLIKSKPAGGS